MSTVAEARAAEEAGADVVVVQGMEAGGHRGCFDAAKAEIEMVGLFALVPAVVNAVRIPVVATGGIADSRGVAAALSTWGQRGTNRHRISTMPGSKAPPGRADALRANTARRDHGQSRVQRSRRSLHCNQVCAGGTGPAAPPLAPYPVQRGLPRRCATRPFGKATSTACRPGLVKARRFPARYRPGNLHVSCGRMLSDCSGDR